MAHGKRRASWMYRVDIEDTIRTRSITIFYAFTNFRCRLPSAAHRSNGGVSMHAASAVSQTGDIAVPERARKKCRTNLKTFVLISVKHCCYLPRRIPGGRANVIKPAESGTELRRKPRFAWCRQWRRRRWRQCLMAGGLVSMQRGSMSNTRTPRSRRRCAGCLA